MSQMPGTGIGDMFAQKQKDVGAGLFTIPGPDQRRMGGGDMPQGGYGNYQPMGTGLAGGYGGYGGNGGNGGNDTAGLPAVSDPEQAYADMTRNQYLDYVKNFRGFEEDLLERAQNDTSLIDQARIDSADAAQLTAGMADRNASRYGVALTPAQRQQQGRRLQSANTLGGIQAVNDSRLAQKDANQAVIGDLINIGQGVNRSSLSSMQGAAANASQRKNAYDSAKAQSKAQTYSTLGSLGAAAIFAFAL